jgi:hypothetical protein
MTGLRDLGNEPLEVLQAGDSIPVSAINHGDVLTSTVWKVDSRSESAFQSD